MPVDLQGLLVAVRFQPLGVNAPLSLSSGFPTHTLSLLHTSPFPPFLWLVLGSLGFSRGIPISRLPSRLALGVLGGFPVAPKRAARSISPGAGDAPSSPDHGPCSFSALLSIIFQESMAFPLAQGSVLLRLRFVFLSGAWVQVG